MKPRPSRRTALKATGSLGIGIATGSLLATNAIASEKFEGEINRARHTIDKYRRLEKARQKGYVFLDIIGFVGVVFFNSENIGNLKHSKDPSALFYAPKPGSGLTTDSDEDDVSNENTELAGLEYHAPGRPDDPDEDIFHDEESSRTFKVSEAEGWHNNPGGAKIHGIHVWTHLDNPNGVFAKEHPTIEDRLTD